MEKYAELIAALKKAREKATEAGLLSDDGGTCTLKRVSTDILFRSITLYQEKHK